MAFVQHETTVREQVRLAKDSYRLRLECPEIAAKIQPGQFVMLRLPGRLDPLLGRAFALYDLSPDGGAIDIVYLVVGKMTRAMTELTAGDHVEIWGPLGLPFPSYAGTAHLVMVAGGVGITPFPALARRVLGLRGYGGDVVQPEVERISLYYGVRTAEYRIADGELLPRGLQARIATDDGSAGRRGFVTQLLAEDFRSGSMGPSVRWVGCGPEPMLHALASLAEQCGVPCDVSLETPMACGVGICFSCVTRVKTADGWDYRRTCVEGPVFPSDGLVW
jgi:dihydroorotate dehydrogenase electron transfer subunit